jgi:hypothetical protein
MTISLHGRTIDLRKALPLTIGDWKRLEQLGITDRTLREPSITTIATLVHYVLHKADPQTTMEEIDALPLTAPAVQETLRAINQETVDAPFSTPSTPSVAPTGGPSGT